MTELRLAVIDIPDAGMRLDQFRQVAYVTHETERKFLCAPDAPPSLDLKLFVEVVQMQCGFLKVAEIHVVPNGRIKRYGEAVLAWNG